MDNQEVLKNAPKGNSKSIQVTSIGDVLRWSDEKWRSLDDIRQIEELKRELNKAKTKVKNQKLALSDLNNSFSQIARERDELKKPIDLIDRIIFKKDSLEVTKLEQQAKGANNVIRYWFNNRHRAGNEYKALDEVADDYVNQLRTQAKELSND